jgi:hypothetical protein
MFSIFIKGCREQLHWLCANLQLLTKNWLGPEPEIVVMLDQDCQEVIKTWGPFPHLTYIYVDPWPDRYMHALWAKATADYWTRGDPIILMDCDTIFLRPVALTDFMQGDKIKLPYLPWTRAPGGAIEIWPRVVKESTGLDLAVDYLCARPWPYWRTTFAGARGLIESYRDTNFYAAVYSEAQYDWTRYFTHPFTFCEIETLGLYAATFDSHRYHIDELEKIDWPPGVKDYWSHTDFTPVIQEELAAALTL